MPSPSWEAVGKEVGIKKDRRTTSGNTRGTAGRGDGRGSSCVRGGTGTGWRIGKAPCLASIDLKHLQFISF